eukprot:2214813-Rhodomonas_salina.1
MPICFLHEPPCHSSFFETTPSHEKREEVRPVDSATTPEAICLMALLRLFLRHQREHRPAHPHKSWRLLNDCLFRRIGARPNLMQADGAEKRKNDVPADDFYRAVL